MTDRFVVGRLDELQARGWLATKAGSQPVCVFWTDGQALAIDDRCPHMGFPLHRGTADSGLVTCHWHNARFDLTTGGTLDPWADDVRAFPVEVVGGEVAVVIAPATDQTAHLRGRLVEGLERGITLVTAKAVLGLLEAKVPASDILREGYEFGSANRGPGWGSGLTVLTAMANVLDDLDRDDQALALIHGLAFVSRDTSGHAPRFALAALDGRLPSDRLAAWYRRFVDTRSSDAAERTLASAIATDDRDLVAAMMFAATTDHVFLDGGHTLDFTNKAFEAVDHLGWEAGAGLLPTLVAQTASARRAEEQGSWRYPHDLAAMIETATAALPTRWEASAPRRQRVASDGEDPTDVSALGWSLLAEDPAEVVAALDAAIGAGAGAEPLGRAVAYAAALRITRFHVQNDHGDWDEVHHAFTAAHALHRALVRHPTPELLRGLYHGALRVYLDRFLNIPAARLPAPPDDGGASDLADLVACWDREGGVDEAGGIVYRHVRLGRDPQLAIRALGHALLSEDAEFHWYQTFEAAVGQFHAWPADSEEAALILAGAARFLAAHTPTRRELPQVVRIATRLRRGEELFEDG
jgi:nitrite reductase/ring-hydroxylating ferredoxin subunit